RIEGLHPHMTMLILALVGITFVFLFLLIAYYRTRQPFADMPFPKAFTLSTAMIVISSFVINHAVYNFEDDRIYGIRNSLLATVILGTLFSVFQIYGWVEMYFQGFSIEGYVGANIFLYLLTGLHFLHLMGGMYFMVRELYRVQKMTKDEIRYIVYITDPYEKLKLKMVKTYWHFMDGIWVGIFFAFTFVF
ncbi:MAG: cytochrome c oxidase subunit 3, partial [Cytophagales bacterium]|nr:cytochrome c oxidase subunit 3 [Cytophagales bacterium]